MRLKLLPAGVAAFVLLLSAASAHACTCIVVKSPCQQFGASSAVFVGTVTGVTERPPGPAGEGAKPADFVKVLTQRGHRFAVARAYLGVEGAEAEVWTAGGEGACGYDFKPGESYLVYASSAVEGGLLMTGVCTRTRPVSNAAEDLEFLEGLSGRPPGVTISGAVRRLRRDSEGKAEVGDAMAGVVLVAEGEGESRTASTDAEGRYSLAGLKAGAYRLKLLLPEGLAAGRAERKLKVADRGCAVEDFHVSEIRQGGGR